MNRLINTRLVLGVMIGVAVLELITVINRTFHAENGLIAVIYMLTILFVVVFVNVKMMHEVSKSNDE